MLLETLMKKIFGDPNAKELKEDQVLVDKINALEPEMEKLSDARLCGKTDEFRQRLTKGETLDDLLVEAFAVVREADRRVLGLRPFDVQLIGGCVLHKGKIAEMRRLTYSPGCELQHNPTRRDRRGGDVCCFPGFRTAGGGPGVVRVTRDMCHPTQAMSAIWHARPRSRPGRGRAKDRPQGEISP